MQHGYHHGEQQDQEQPDALYMFVNALDVVQIQLVLFVDRIQRRRLGDVKDALPPGNFLAREQNESDGQHDVREAATARAQRDEDVKARKKIEEEGQVLNQAILDIERDMRRGLIKIQDDIQCRQQESRNAQQPAQGARGIVILPKRRRSLHGCLRCRISFQYIEQRRDGGLDPADPEL